MTTATSFWIVAPQTGQFRSESLPPLAPNEVGVRTLYSGISRGTERLVFKGDVPVSQYPVMRAPFMAGEFPFPVKYGYCNVGVVVEGGPAWQGARVFSLFPHQDYFHLRTDDLLRIPETVPSERAVLAANMETALNSIWDSDLRIGDRVAVIGAGVVGCLIAYLAAQIPAVNVTLIDTYPPRQTIADHLNIPFQTPDQVQSEFDRIFHASGHPAGLQTALQWAAPEAQIIEASWFGDTEVCLPLGEAFHSRRLQVIGSQVGSVAISRRTRYTSRQRLALALSLLADDRLDALFTDRIAFADLPEQYPRLLNAASVLGIIVKY